MNIFPPKEAKRIGGNENFTYYEMHISPKIAQEFLTINDLNRKIRNHHVLHLSLQMCDCNEISYK